MAGCFFLFASGSIPGPRSLNESEIQPHAGPVAHFNLSFLGPSFLISLASWILRFYTMNLKHEVFPGYSLLGADFRQTLTTSAFRGGPVVYSDMGLASFILPISRQCQESATLTNFAPLGLLIHVFSHLTPPEVVGFKAWAEGENCHTQAEL